MPRRLRVEVDERINGTGKIVQPLSMASVETALARLLDDDVESIATCLLSAPANPVHEREVAEFVRRAAPGIALSVSSEVMPLFGEYERTSETVLNAYVMPLVARYLRKLQSELVRIGITAPLYIMQSSGGMTTPENSMHRPIEIIECGPAPSACWPAHPASTPCSISPASMATVIASFSPNHAGAAGAAGAGGAIATASTS